MSEKQLVRHLLQRGLLRDDQAMRVLASQAEQGLSLVHALLDGSIVAEEPLLAALVSVTSLPVVAEAELLAPAYPPDSFPRSVAERLCALPLEVDVDLVRVVLADPFDPAAIELIRRAFEVKEVTLVLAKRSLVRAAIASWYEPLFEDETVPASLPAPPPPPPRAPVVLLADRDVALTEQLAAALKDFDCEVVIAHDGEAARSLAREKPPSVALLDASLPHVDGFTLLLELRARSPEAALFVTSNRADEFRQTKALDLGADDFLVKPLSVPVLASKLKREVQKRWDAAPKVDDGVSGSLERMDLLEIIQTLGFGQKTVHITIEYEDGKRGEVGMSGGALTGCRFEGVDGEPGFFALVRQMGKKGRFQIQYRTSPLAVTLEKDNSYLMMEAVRRIDEENRT